MRTYTEETMSLLERIVERLKEIFQEQNYQTRLEQYIRSRNPQTIAEAEYYAKAFERNEFGRLGL
jgi:hypothetical protein